MDCERCGAPMAFQAMGGVCVCRECGHVAVPDDVAAQRAQVDALTIMRMALAFYADESNYQGAMPVLADGGQLARETLMSCTG